MTELVSKPEYEEQLAASRDRRMAWWREARFGMFIHFGLYSVLGRHEYAMVGENWPVKDYEKLADKFLPRPGAPREWARLAKAAGMKYMVMTSRHHEGFSLWDSRVNPYNSMNYGCKRDIVREFVDACHEFDLRFGFYSSLMDWHHGDAGRAAYDSAARKRFTDYIYGLNEELLSKYGKIDILWFDVAKPMENYEGWNSLEMNQKLRAIQPEIIINNRSLLAEDFGTPEGRITPEQGRDWEACMTFNDLSWGYIDSKQAATYSHTPQTILRMLATCSNGSGNLLLNIGPMPDGSVPPEAVEPLTIVGKWLEKNGEAAYGRQCSLSGVKGVGNRLSTLSQKGNKFYIWNWIWPEGSELIVGGLVGKLKSAHIVATGQKLDFTQEKYRIILKNINAKDRDPIAGVTVVVLEFEEEPKLVSYASQPPLCSGRVYK